MDEIRIGLRLDRVDGLLEILRAVIDRGNDRNERPIVLGVCAWHAKSFLPSGRPPSAPRSPPEMLLLLVPDASLRHPTTSALGIGTMNCPPQARMPSICFMISSLRFHGRIRTKSGFTSQIFSGGNTGICVPGRKRPCLYGLRSTVNSRRSVRIPQ